jgi:hypothetical protein
VTLTAIGDQGASGTYYVNINSTVPFLTVVATGGVFEFDNVAYNPTIPVPEPSTAALLFAGVLAALFVVRKRV